MARTAVIAVVGLCAAILAVPLTPDANAAAPPPASCGAPPPTGVLLDRVRVRPPAFPPRFEQRGKVDLSPRQTYTIVVCGEQGYRDANNDFNYDPLYCYGRSPSFAGCDAPPAPPSLERRASLATSDGGRSGGLDRIAGRPGSIPYRADHTYSAKVRGLDGELGLTFSSVPCDPSRCSGGFTAEVYGLPSKPYAVSFSVKQLGESNPPRPASEFRTRTETRGTLYLDAVPKAGKRARGPATGSVIHNDEWIEPLPVVHFPNRQLTLRIIEAIYRKSGPFRRDLAIRARVTSTSGDERIHPGTRVGGIVTIGFRDGTDTQRDLLQWGADHEYTDGPENDLDVKISSVRRRR